MAYLYGLLNQADLANERVTDVGFDQVDTAIRMSVEEHNRQMDALLALFAMRTTEFKTRYMSPSSARLQPLDENGRARPVKSAGYYDVGYPLQMGGIAWGLNYITAQKITVGELAREASMRMDADMRWLRDHLLAALFVDGSWTFTDPLKGQLTVYGLASGDSTTYNIISGADSGATDDHVLGSAALDVAVFTTIHDELVEHPENSGEVIAFIPSASRTTVEGLDGFYPVVDNNLRYGTGSTVLNGRLGVATPGTLIGYIEQCWVYEWAGMPSDYVLGITTGGDRPLAMREDPEPELRGFREVAERNNHPWYERQLIRRAGFGAWNRVGGVVVRTNNATYAVPTNYGSPMA